jgi:putative intracellular protease/amidase
MDIPPVRPSFEVTSPDILDGAAVRPERARERRLHLTECPRRHRGVEGGIGCGGWDERSFMMAKLLFVMTGAAYWTLRDGTRHATGYWAEEFVAPYRALTEADHQVVVATPGGVVPTVDMMSLRPELAGGAQLAVDLEQAIRSAEELRRPVQLAMARLEDYDAVYLPGGHGPMEDLWADADAGRLLTAALASGKPLALVCHAPAALLASRVRGRSPFTGYRVTAFTNEEEKAVGLAGRAPWLLENALKELGVAFTCGEIWRPYTVVDRNLYTGQNPASALVLAQRLLSVLV